MKCRICERRTEEIFSTKVLGKYQVKYYRCLKCSFIQTEDPFWLEEAYGSGAISVLDVGLINRNNLLSEKSEDILTKIFNDFSSFIGVDYGGGHGIYVRMMRDKGFNFYRQDKYAENVYSRFFDVEDLPSDVRFNVLTAFEVFEHLSNPMGEIKKMFELSDIILLTTELQPSIEVEILRKWWYLVPEGGQHISFYHQKTFAEIAQNLEVNYYTDANNLHILSKRQFPKNPFVSETKKRNLNWYIKHFFGNQSKFNWENHVLYKRESLTTKDFEFVKQKIRSAYDS